MHRVAQGSNFKYIVHVPNSLASSAKMRITDRACTCCRPLLLPLALWLLLTELLCLTRVGGDHGEVYRAHQAAWPPPGSYPVSAHDLVTSCGKLHSLAVAAAAQQEQPGAYWRLSAQAICSAFSSQLCTRFTNAIPAAVWPGSLEACGCQSTGREQLDVGPAACRFTYDKTIEREDKVTSEGQRHSSYEGLEAMVREGEREGERERERERERESVCERSLVGFATAAEPGN